MTLVQQSGRDPEEQGTDTAISTAAQRAGPSVGLDQVPAWSKTWATNSPAGSRPIVHCSTITYTS